MLLHQALGNGQSQPSPFPHAFCSGTQLIELAEDRFVLLRRYADTRIDHRGCNRAGPSDGFDPDLSAFGGEFYGVAQQIIENLLEPYTVGVHGDAALEPALDRDGFLSAERPDAGERFL